MYVNARHSPNFEANTFFSAVKPAFNVRTKSIFVAYMTDLLRSESYISKAYEKLVENLRSELGQYLSNPRIRPVSFHIDFKKNAASDEEIVFHLANGTLNGKMVNLNRNNSVVLNYAFRIGEENNETARGLFKVKISEGTGESGFGEDF